MAYQLATEKEIDIARERWAKFPWAAGEPGTMFDKPGDILWSNGGDDTQVFKDWAAENNIPTFLTWRDGNYAKVEGWNPLTYQKGVKITLRRDDADMTELFRVLDVIIPEMLPTVVCVRGRRADHDGWIKGLFFSLSEPSLSEHASFGIFYSGDTWILLQSRGTSSSVDFEDTDREAFFNRAREMFGWSDDSKD